MAGGVPGAELLAGREPRPVGLARPGLVPGAGILARMITRYAQRWHLTRPRWVERTRFEPARYTVHHIDEITARTFVQRHHYAGTWPAAIHRLGLFDGDVLVGVAVYASPVQAKVLTNMFPELEPYRQSVELSRFVLEDAVPGNAESWFIARCHRMLLDLGVRGVVSFSDPVPRRLPSGVLFKGHIGFIYQASNAVYTGTSAPRTVLLLERSGTAQLLHERALAKVRAQDSGHEAVERMLVEHGARAPRAGEDMSGWLREALNTVGARPMRHTGNHRYAFPLGASGRDRARIRIGLPERPYPKPSAVAA